MTDSYASEMVLLDLPLLRKARNKKTLLMFTLEITERCNNDCPHCYINTPANDTKSLKNELSFDQIKKIVDDAVSLGALWCLITGGEPFLRDDFFDIYLYLKQKGLLVSVYTNATMITDEHIKIFKKYVPREIEISVYGISQKTYGKVTKKPGNFDKCMRAIERLSESGLPLSLKATLTRSNYKELAEIKRFVQKKTTRPFRFDPFLQLRNDRNVEKNKTIKSLRLSASQILDIEKNDEKRKSSLDKKCNLIQTSDDDKNNDKLIKCSAGLNQCSISSDGFLKLCTALCHKNFIFDLKKASLIKAWKTFVPNIRKTRLNKTGPDSKCRNCNLIDLCMWCPAHAYLEVGELEGFSQYFCDLAKKRFENSILNK